MDAMAPSKSTVLLLAPDIIAPELYGKTYGRDSEIASTQAYFLRKCWQIVWQLERQIVLFKICNTSNSPQYV